MYSRGSLLKIGRSTGAATSKAPTRGRKKSAQNVLQPLTLKTQLSLYGARVPGTSTRQEKFYCTMEPLLYEGTSTKEALAYQSTRPNHPIQEKEPLIDKGTSTIQAKLCYTRDPLLYNGPFTMGAQGPGPWALGPALAYQSTRPTHPIQEREPLLDKGTFTIQGNLYYTMEFEIRVFESMQVQGTLYYTREPRL